MKGKRRITFDFDNMSRSLENLGDVIAEDDYQRGNITMSEAYENAAGWLYEASAHCQRMAKSMRKMKTGGDKIVR